MDQSFKMVIMDKTDLIDIMGIMDIGEIMLVCNTSLRVRANRYTVYFCE